MIIRFSSFGDVLQCLSVAGALKSHFADGEVHWVTRDEFAPLIRTHPGVAKVWALEPSLGWKGLVKLAWDLRREGYTHVYDAHNNLRSRVIGWILCSLGGARLLRRSIYRWRRLLLFRFRVNRFPKPFNGQADLLRPLGKWGVPLRVPEVPQLYIKPDAVEKVRREISAVCRGPFVAIAPSAAFPLKRWPLEHWAELIKLQPTVRFVILGGPKDTFLEDLVTVDPARVFSFAGRWSLAESAAAVQLSRALIANDTGLLHAAEQLGIPCVALMGPAPFGFPSRPRTKILELNLNCRPCSKHGQGPCINPEYQKCLRDISPATVNQELRRIIFDSELQASP